MPNTTTYRFGDVVLVPFPFTDLTTVKRRPAVVVSSDPYHRHYPDVILIAVTGQIQPRPIFAELSITQWKQAGLRRPSQLKPVLASLEKSLIVKKLGRLKEKDRLALARVLDEILGE